MKKNIYEIKNNRTIKKAAIGISAAALALTMGISACSYKTRDGQHL